MGNILFPAFRLRRQPGVVLPRRAVRDKTICTQLIDSNVIGLKKLPPKLVGFTDWFRRYEGIYLLCSAKSIPIALSRRLMAMWVRRHKDLILWNDISLQTFLKAALPDKIWKDQTNKKMAWDGSGSPPSLLGKRRR